MNEVTGTREYRQMVQKYGSTQGLINMAFGAEDIQKYSILKSRMLAAPKIKNRVIDEAYVIDMSVCAYIKLTGQSVSYKQTYGYDSITKIKVPGYTELIKVASSMIKDDLPLPSTFIRAYNEVIKVEYTSHEWDRLCRKYHRDKDYLTKYAEGTLMADMIDTINSDIDNPISEKVFYALTKTTQAYEYLLSGCKGGTELFDTLASKLYRKKYFRQIDDVERLATKREIKRGAMGVFYKKMSIVSDETVKKILICCWVMTGKDKYYRDAKLYNIDDNKDRIRTYADDIVASMDYMVSTQFIDTDSDIILKTPEFDDYPDVVEDDPFDGVEGAKDLKVRDMCKVVRDKIDPAFEKDQYLVLAFNIATQALSRKNFLLSEKQLFSLENAYNKISKNGKQSSKPKDPGVFSEDLLQKAKEAKKKAARSAKKGNEYCKKVFAICESVITYKSASEKQAALICKYYDKHVVSPVKQIADAVDAIEISDDIEVSSQKDAGDTLPAFGSLALGGVIGG